MTTNKILVANRGEIAVRILRACREAGIPSVSIYSEPDEHSMHARLADECVCVGAPQATASYLNIGKILDAARESGADAVHPGYGFLSESAEFCDACTQAGITYIGPRAETIQLLGDKIRAKALVEAAGVPVVPGYNGADQSYDSMMHHASLIGTPLLIKASAGGGGRGMRVVLDLGEFHSMLSEARQEARAAFGSDSMLLERYIRQGRHIEVQIAGDWHGKTIHLFERDCSVQRRNQKIIEESPAPVLGTAIRNKILSAAMKVAEVTGYNNLGTVEFLVDESDKDGPKAYFLEVNTRLQVEHPITEMVTGIDLVRLQIAIANGKRLSFNPEDIVPRGHSVEVRICAEDPGDNFQPSAGTLTRWRESCGPGIRVDSGVCEGDTVSPYYDPLLAKLIVHAESREFAIQKLRSALSQFVVLGIETNLTYLQEIAANADWNRGGVETTFLATEFGNYYPKMTIPDVVLAELARAAFETSPVERSATAKSSNKQHSFHWNAWRNA